MTELERYLSAGRLAGCPADQMDNFVNAGIILQERQLLASAAARLCDHPDGPTAIGYGGARGGGKSHWLLAQMGADDCQRVPGLKCLLLRKVGKANLEHFDDLRRRLFAGLKHEFSAYRGILTFANGSRIIAGHFQNENDIDAYLGLEYDLIGIEEATTLTARKYQDISTCCRSSKPFPLSTPSGLSTLNPQLSTPSGRGGDSLSPLPRINPPPSGLSTLNSQLSTPYWRPRIYSTTNPGGIGHAWYRKLFIQPRGGDSLSPLSRGGDSLSPLPSPLSQPLSQPLSAFVGTPTAPSHPSSPSPQASPSSSTCNLQPAPCNLPPSPTHVTHVTHVTPGTFFIPARVDDNAFNNPEYRRVLENLTGWQKRAWLEGDWDIAAGQFFTTFRRDIHVIADFDDTRAREWFAALDYGFAHYTAVLLGCLDGDGNLFVVDEHAERLWLPQRHAQAIRAMLARHGLSLSSNHVPQAEPCPSNLPPNAQSSSTCNLQPAPCNHSLARFVAGADVFSRQSDGTTIAAQYAREGIRLRPANMDRVNGWAEVLQRLGDPSAGIPPRLFIHQRCARLLDALPSLQHDPNRPEDVLKVDADDDGLGGDDAADALRYLVATKPRVIIVRKLRGF